MADVLTHQIIAGSGHHVSLADVAEAMQDLRHPLGHGGLTGARPAGKGHMEARWSRLQPQLAPGPVHHQQSRDFTDPGLHRPQTHQFLIQLVEHRLDAGRVVGPTQINRERIALLLLGDLRLRLRAGGRLQGIRGVHRSPRQRPDQPLLPAAPHPA